MVEGLGFGVRVFWRSAVSELLSIRTLGLE